MSATETLADLVDSYIDAVVPAKFETELIVTITRRAFYAGAIAVLREALELGATHPDAAAEVLARWLEEGDAFRELVKEGGDRQLGRHIAPPKVLDS